MAVKYLSIKNVILLNKFWCAIKFGSSRFFATVVNIAIRWVKPWPVFLLLSLYFCFCQSNQQNHNPAAEILPAAAESLLPEHLDSLQQSFIELEIEELYWRNRVAMSGDKSIDLAIDLVDSMVYLDIKGG